MKNLDFLVCKHILTRLDTIEALIRRINDARNDCLEAIEDETPLCRTDVEEMITMANMFRGDRSGGPAKVPPLEVHEFVGCRSEYVAFATEIRRCWERIDYLEREAGLR